MKKRIVVVTICVGIIMVVCGCQPKVRRIGNTVSSTQISNNSNSESVESFDVNKTVYEDNLVVLKCKEITDRYILFEVVNKTDYEIEWLNLQTSLDGVQLPLYSYDSSDKNITAQETREIEMDGEIGQAEHNRISLSGNVFIDGTSKGEIDVSDMELGGKENVPEIKTQNQIVFCKHFLEKNAKYFWRMLHLQIGESCKASAGSYSASYIAIADHI